MGSEIDETRFSREDFRRFNARLREETLLLKQWLQDGTIADGPACIGLELESWLVDAQGGPAPHNHAILDQLREPLLAPELAQYNLELNTTPLVLTGTALSRLGAELQALWQRIDAAAQSHGSRLAMVGILPSLREQDLSLDRMTQLRRYHALNEQVLALRNQRPLRLEISGEEQVRAEHHDVMLEAAATSLQLHLQVAPAQAPAYYNAAALASAATVAVAANSPFLFGRRLWEETRIPVFEQAVAVGPLHGGHAGPLARVGFGSGYGRDGLYNFFVENRQHYPVLLPVPLDQPADRLPHLQLHNGTIWRWNRPLVGLDRDGRPHLRIEHRVMAAGPTLVDTLANAAFFYGLVHGLALEAEVERHLPFPVVEHNFYQAARYGLEAEVRWLEGASNLRRLVLGPLLQQAERGLAALGVDPGEAQRLLGIIEARVGSGQTGALWQRRWVERHGRDFRALTRSYLERQQGGEPVHGWPL